MHQGYFISITHIETFSKNLHHYLIYFTLKPQVTAMVTEWYILFDAILFI